MKTVILGGGIAGLLAAYVLRKRKPILIEGAARLGGNFTAGGLKYIQFNEHVRQLLTELDIPSTPYLPLGRVYWDGVVHSHVSLAAMSPPDRERIQRTHWLKTRGTPKGFNPTCMNEPTSGQHTALKCDHFELIRRLESRIREAGVEVRLGAQVRAINSTSIGVRDGADSEVWLDYDHLIPTLPMGLLSKMAPWIGLPHADATTLGILSMQVVAVDPEWDYMYTPDAPLVSRIVWSAAGEMMAELPNVGAAENPEWIRQQTVWEVSAVTKLPFALMHSADIKHIPGHLRPLSFEPTWPSHWHPLGRFAEWNARATMDKVLLRAHHISEALT